MDKKLLIETLRITEMGAYSWNLYFFKIDRRSRNPYSAYKIRFRSDNYLLEYARSLVDMVVKYQFGKINEITNYTGENTKISCDKIEINNELIREQWEYFAIDIAEASDEKMTGKYQGYVLEGTPTEENENTVAFFKMANPIINLKNKRNVVFTFNEDNELAEVTDEVCKLYMDVDFIIIDDMIYTFNYKFEDFFNIEKTMKKIKNKALDEIFSIDAFENREEFERMAKSYKSPRTFLTLKRERVEKIKDKFKRKEIAGMLKIDVGSDGKFIFKNDEEVALLIRYLCFKVFKDDETKELLEANNVVPLLI